MALCFFFHVLIHQMVDGSQRCSMPRWTDCQLQNNSDSYSGFFFEGTVIGAAYLNMLQESVPTIRQLYGDEDVSTTLPLWCQGLSWQHFSWLMDRTQRICWVTPMITRFNYTWLFLLGLHEGCGVQHKASNTSRTPTRNLTVLGSRPSSNIGGHLSVSCSLLSTVPQS